MFACACLYLLCDTNRLRPVPELRGIDDQDLVNHRSWDQALRVLRDRRPWASAWWRQVSSDPLCPIYFIIHCPAYYEQPKDLLAFYLPCPWFTFWVTMVNCMLALYSNKRTWWELLDDTMLLFWIRWWYTCDILGDSGHFPEYLSVRTCSLRDHPG